MMTPRRFPPPWSIDEANDACFILRDSTGQALGYFYFEEEPGRRSAAKLLTKDEARRLAVNPNIASLDLAGCGSAARQVACELGKVSGYVALPLLADGYARSPAGAAATP